MTAGEKFEKLIQIMQTLRSEHGCQWDRKQTHESLRPYLLEEAYEALEAIDLQDYAAMREELGDVLLQVVFHAQIAAESGRFDIADIICRISDKMVRRHPHVFGDEKIESPGELKLRWEEIKSQEGKKSAIDGIPRTLPALQRAARIQQRAGVTAPASAQLEQSMAALLLKLASHDSTKGAAANKSAQAEAGDLLFMLVAALRTAGINPEDVLRETCERFARQFEL